MKYTCAIAISLLLSSSLPALPVLAEETDPLQGSVRLGFMFMDAADNLDPGASEEYLSDLNSAPEKSTLFIPVVIPDVSYDVGEPGGGKLFLNVDRPIDEASGLTLNAGGRYPVEGIGILHLSAFNSFFKEAWENPYLVNEKREDTDVTEFGIKFGLNKIMGTGLSLNTVIMQDDVDEDLIGALEPDLARDGMVYALNANYAIVVAPTFVLRPSISLRRGEYDGASNSFYKIKTALQARWTTGRWTFLPQLSYGHSEYDETHPIFNTTREGDSYSAELMVNYTAPFAIEQLSIQGLLGYSKGTSNITFFENEAVSTGLFFSYAF